MQSDNKINKEKITAKEISETEGIEMNLLLNAVNQKYGYDFQNYNRAHLKRRILQRLKLSNLSTISELQNRVLWDKNFFHIFLQDLSKCYRNVSGS